MLLALVQQQLWVHNCAPMCCRVRSEILWQLAKDKFRNTCPLVSCQGRSNIPHFYVQTTEFINSIQIKEELPQQWKESGWSNGRMEKDVQRGAS
jgi:hypothetical protein